MVEFYNSGKEFYNINKDELANYDLSLVNTFINDINEFSIYNYCIKVTKEKSRIYALCLKQVGLYILGDLELCEELLSIIFISNLIVPKLIGNDELCRKFNQLYLEQNRLNIKRALFAGGCFWCIASNFYDLNGVIEVYSGYASGNTFFPKYQEVKSGITGHKESIMIVYDQDKISYNELLKVFFENIDPFDGEGQFIDRGSSYQTAVFTDDNEERKYYNLIKDNIETKYNKKIEVPLLKNCVFYLAEDEHQKFSIFNKEKFELEEEISGRNSFGKIKID